MAEMRKLKTEIQNILKRKREILDKFEGNFNSESKNLELSPPFPRVSSLLPKSVSRWSLLPKSVSRWSLLSKSVSRFPEWSLPGWSLLPKSVSRWSLLPKSVSRWSLLSKSVSRSGDFSLKFEPRLREWALAPIAAAMKHC
ncbi:hypothetical protein DPMN_158604 [Dreissena polymorpha]|uniref:Uncharacterized protein n=1 Tax=Dreissena polymorpha TaxID=45954 RepID=A0A9D4EMS5_DREPO|nr:hypothetical protein DPMN_158604 [Dreissena polymorpha]